MGTTKLPKGKEWEKIIDDAFSSEDIHIFSDNYCRRRAALERGVIMKRTNTRSKRRYTGAAAIAAAVLLVPTVTIAGLRMNSGNKKPDSDQKALVNVEPSTEDITGAESSTEASEISYGESFEDYTSSLKFLSDGDTIYLPGDSVKLTLDKVTYQDDFAGLDCDQICEPADYSGYLGSDGKLDPSVFSDADGSWKVMVADFTYENVSDEALDICIESKVFFRESDKFERLDENGIFHNKFGDLASWFSCNIVEGNRSSKNNVMIQPGETAKVRRAILVREDMISNGLLLDFSFESGVEYVFNDRTFCLKDLNGNTPAVIGYVDLGDMKFQASASFVSEGDETEVSSSASEGNQENQEEQEEDSLLEAVDDYDVEYTFIPDGFETGGPYEGKFHKIGASGGITPCGLAKTSDFDRYIDSIVNAADYGLPEINPDLLPYTQDEPYYVVTADANTPDVTVYTLNRHVPDNLDDNELTNGYFNRDVVLRFKDTDYVEFLYVHSFVTQDELDTFIRGIKISPVTNLD